LHWAQGRCTLIAGKNRAMLEGEGKATEKNECVPGRIEINWGITKKKF